MQKKLLFLFVLSFAISSISYAQNADLIKVFNETDTVTVSDLGRSITASNGKLYEFLKDSIQVTVWDTADTSTPILEREILNPDFFEVLYSDYESVGNSQVISLATSNKTNPAQGITHQLRIYQSDTFGGGQFYTSNPNFPMFGKQPFYSFIGRVSEDKFFVFDPVNIRAIAFERASNGVSMAPTYDIDMTAVSADSSHIGGIGGRRDANVLYVWNKEQNEIVRLDTSGTIRFRYDFDNQSDIPGRDLEILGFHVEDNGRVVVTTSDAPEFSAKVSDTPIDQRIVFLGGGFQFLGSIEMATGDTHGSLNAVEQVAVDYDGNIYLGESGNRNMSMLDYFDHAPHNSGAYQVRIQPLDIGEVQPIDYESLVLLDWNIQDTVAAIKLVPLRDTSFPLKIFFDSNADGNYSNSERVGTNIQDTLFVTAQQIQNGQLVAYIPDPFYTGNTLNLFDYKWSDNGNRFNPDVRGRLQAEINTDKITITGVSGKDGWRLLAPTREGETFQEYLAPLWTQGAIGSDLPTGAPNVFTYSSPDEEWIPVTDFSQTLSIGDGFAMYIYEDDDFFSEGIQGGWPKILQADLSKTAISKFTEITFPLEYNTNLQNPEFRGYNLIGNPYASGFRSYDNGLLGEPGLNGIAYWDASLNNGEGGYEYGFFSTNTTEVVNLAPGQGFWVGTAEANSEITFNQLNTAVGEFLIPKSVPANTLEILLIDEGYEDAIRLKEGAGTFKKLNSISSDYHEVYTFGEFGKKLAINSLDFDTSELTVSIGIRSTRFEKATLMVESSISVQNSFIRQVLAGGEVVIHQPKDGKFEINLIQSADEWTHEGSLEMVLQKSTQVSNEEVEVLPERFEMGTYPNPFNPSTTINFSLPQANSVSIDVFNIMGQKVAQLLQNEQRSAGIHTLKLDMSNQASGVYLVIISTPGNAITQKITLIK